MIVTTCRICKTKLRRLFTIAPQYIASTFVRTNRNYPKIKIPMTPMLCPTCGLVQLRETVTPDLLFRKYFYRSNVSKTMNRDLQDVVRDVWGKAPHADRALDIGCNDGLMMTFFPPHIKTVGIDPAQNIIPVRNGLNIITDYFPSPRLTLRYDIITSTAMFYDFSNPNTAVREMKKLLNEDGVICIQVSYLYDTIKDMNFYDFVHEHLEYYSLETLIYLMRRNGLEVFDASTNFVNGGSLRIMVGHPKKHEKSSNLEYLLLKEKMMRLRDVETYKIFHRLILMSAKKIVDYIKEQRGLVIALGASTKGNVLLQLCGIDKKMIPFISERSPHKWGLRNIGLDMKLISEEEARKKKPVCMFVIPWNFKAEIVAREEKYIQQGGKLLFIMPYPYILDKEGEHRL
jgi:SAM-dependent methyltransferase